MPARNEPLAWNRRQSPARRRPLAAAVMTALAMAVRLGVAAVPTVVEIAAEAEKGHTAKAARLAERALAEGEPADIAALRFLLLRIHVQDLAPGGGALLRQVTRDAKDGMPEYEAHLDGLETDVRVLGEKALPVLADRVRSGDPLDRLLALGILADMARDDPTLPWHHPLDMTGEKPIATVRSAVGAAAIGCAVQEAAFGVHPPEDLEDGRAREPYMQSVYAVESGLEFLALADPPAWGSAAAEALECRGAAEAVVEDRARVRRFGRHLLGPIRRRLEVSTVAAARVDLVDLIGALGECQDLGALLPGAATPEEDRRRAAAAERIRARHGCKG